MSERVPRSKYNDVAKARLVYAKQRKHSAASTKKLKRRLLKLLSKLIFQWDHLRKLYSPCICLSAEQEKRLCAVRAVIEHHSFEAFNEGIRLRQCIEYQESLTGIKVSRIGADSIYANNANRTMCTERGITTCFARKGPKPKEEAEHLKTSRRIIGNLRPTVMEGSFGNQKQHYAVGCIKARNMFSETLLLFFGIHTANAAILAARQMAAEMKKAA